jgi:hypothetical protein
MNKKPQKTPHLNSKYKCTNCIFETNNKKDYTKHINTKKHTNNTILNTFEPENPNSQHFNCKTCNKIYKGRNGLWYHEQKCKEPFNFYNIDSLNENSVVDSSENEIKILTNLVLEIVKNNTELQKQNQELQQHVLEVCKNANNNNNNTINSHNKTFNLQVFLNEQCKDAMNLSDFVKSFKLQLSDLELVGDEGFINGMTKVILAKLDGMDANTRPFHCTDLKRETVYVKEDDVWVREGPDNAKLAAAIKAIGHQNFFILKEYKALHPDCESTYSEFNDHYMNLIMKSAGCQKEDIAKVIKKLVKEIVIMK